VPLSPSSIIWYWSKGRRCSTAGKVTAAYCRTPGWLPRDRYQLRTERSSCIGLPYFYLLTFLTDLNILSLLQRVNRSIFTALNIYIQQHLPYVILRILVSRPIYLKLDSLRITLLWVETEDLSSAATEQRLAEGPVGPEYWDARSGAR